MVRSAGETRPSGRFSSGLLAALACWMAGSGCATEAYRAQMLPAEFRAAQTVRLDQIDLSQLTSYAVRSDRVDVGDVLQVTVYSDYGDSRTTPTPVRVDHNGTANVPLIGPVAVAGLSLDAAERAVAAAAIQRDVFRSPHVTVTMEEQRKNRITVVGAVEKPGVHEIPRGNSTLLAAIMEAGGLTEDWSPDVTIRRPALSNRVPGPWQGNPLRLAGGVDAVAAAYDEETAGEASTMRVNLVSATTEGKGGYYLDDGDVVHVKKQPPRSFRVMGLVNTPGEIELPPNKDLYLLDALALAGGRRMEAADSVLVIRRVEGKEEPIQIQASVREAQKSGASNIRLQESDLVVVEETPLTMAFETLKTFFRFSVGSSLALF